jgi:hypothetical protein
LTGGALSRSIPAPTSDALPGAEANAELSVILSETAPMRGSAVPALLFAFDADTKNPSVGIVEKISEFGMLARDHMPRQGIISPILPLLL